MSPDVKKEEYSEDEVDIHATTLSTVSVNQTSSDIDEEICKKSPRQPPQTQQQDEEEQQPSPTHHSNKRKSPISSRLSSSTPPTIVVTTQTILPPQLTPPLSADAIGAPPAKISRVEDTFYQKQQTQRYLELLYRLYPEQKRGVLELILKGCNNDIVHAIECILPSHERAIQQLSTTPSQSYALSTSSKQTNTSRAYTHGANEKLTNGSAFLPFTTGLPPHSASHTTSASCPPGCTCQHQKCDCSDCMSGKTVHSHHSVGMSHSPKPQAPLHMNHHIISKQPSPNSHRMHPYIPAVSSHVPSPHTEPVKICAGCGGKMKLEDNRCPNCEPEPKRD